MNVEIYSIVPVSTPADRFLGKCIREKVVDSNLKVKNQALAPLSEIQLEAFQNLLSKQVEILPQFSLPVWKILKKTQELIEQEQISRQDFLQCVGSALTAILNSDPAYLTSFLKSVSADKLDSLPFGKPFPMPEDVRDFDVRIHLPHTNLEKNFKLKTLLCSWLAQEVFDLAVKEGKAGGKNGFFDAVLARINKKFCNPYEDPVQKPNGNRFMLISLGNKLFTLDIVFEQHLTRKEILSPDRGRLPFNIVPLSPQNHPPFAITHLAWQKIQKAHTGETPPPVIRLEPHQKACRVIFDRLFKIVHFPAKSTMDENGWFKLMHYYLQGYRCAEAEKFLVQRMLSWAEKKAAQKNASGALPLPVSEIIAKKLLDFSGKHIADNAAILYLFNAFLSLQLEECSRLVGPIWKICREKCLPKENSSELIGMLIDLLDSNPNMLESFVNFIRFIGFAHLQNNEQARPPFNKTVPRLTINSGFPAIQWGIEMAEDKILHLMMPSKIRCPDLLDAAFECLEQCVSGGLEIRGYPIANSTVQRFLFTLLAAPGEDKALLFRLIKIKKWLREFPWIFHGGSCSKLDFLLLGIDRIIKAAADSKISYQLADHLNDFIALALEEDLQLSSLSPEEAEKISSKILDVLKISAWGACPLASKTLDILERSLSYLMPRLEEGGKDDTLKALLAILPKYRIKAAETMGILATHLLTYANQFNAAASSKENLEEMILAAGKAASMLSEAEGEQLQKALTALDAIFTALLKRSLFDESLAVLAAMEARGRQHYARYCEQVFRHLELCLENNRDLESLLDLLTAEPWSSFREMMPRRCASLSKSLTEKILNEEARGFSMEKVLLLMQQYRILHPSLWQSLMRLLGREKNRLIFEKAWDLFLQTVMSAMPSASNPLLYVSAWLQGYQTLCKLCPSRRTETPAFYSCLKGWMLDSPLGRLKENLICILLKEYLSLFKLHSANFPPSPLKEYLYHLYQSNLPGPLGKEIKRAWFPILLQSPSEDLYSQGCEALMQTLDSLTDKESLSSSEVLAVQTVFTRTEGLQGKVTPRIAALFDKVSERPEFFDLNWTAVIEAFMQQGTPELMNRAVAKFGRLLVLTKEQRKKLKLSKDNFLFTRQTLDQILALAAEEANGMSDLYGDAIFRVLVTASDKRLKPIWLKCLLRKIAQISSISDMGKLEEEFDSLCYILGQAPEGVATDALVQNPLIDILAGLVKKNIYSASRAEALFVHCGLGKCLDTKKNDFMVIPKNYRKTGSPLKLYGIGTGHSYYKANWFVEAFVDFEQRLLTRLLEDHKYLDLTKPEETSPILEFIDSRMHVLITAVKTHPSSAPAVKVKQLIETFFNYLVSKPKAESIERVFLLETIPAYWKQCEKLYEDGNRLVYNRYFVYAAMMSSLLTKKADAPLPSSKFKPAVKEETVKWLVSTIVNPGGEGGGDLSYALAITVRFLRNEVLASNLSWLGSCVHYILTEMQQGSRCLQPGQEIASILSSEKGNENLGSLLKLIPLLCEKKLKNCSPEEAAAVRVFLTQVIAGLILSVQSFQGCASSDFHPLVPCCRFILETRKMAFESPDQCYNFVAPLIYFSVQEIKSCVERSALSISEQIRLMLFSLIAFNGAAFSEKEINRRAMLMEKFLARLCHMFPDEDPHYHYAVSLFEKTLNLAKSVNVLSLDAAHALSKYLSVLKAVSN